MEDVRHLLKTPVGREKVISGFSYRLWPFLSHLANFYHRNWLKKARIISVVGSFGKSTTLRAIKTSLGLKIHRRDTSNSWSFVAGAVFRIRPSDRHAVIEIGIDRPGGMLFYARTVRPEITVVTSIGSEHNRALGSLEKTRAEKSEMVKILPESGFAVLNGDDPNVLWMASQTRASVITYGLKNTNNIRASNIKLNWPHGTWFTLHANDQIRDLHIRLVGTHMIYPILAATAVLLVEGLCLDEFLPKLESLSPTPGRLEPVLLPNDVILLRDDFKGSLETFHTALDVFADIPAKRKFILIGDISEPPGSQGPIYRDIGKRFANDVWRVIHVGGSFQRYAAGATSSGFPRDALINAKRSILKAAEPLINDLRPGDVVLIKGRDTQRLERIELILKGRKVKCDINFCNVKRIQCAQCQMLERGWNGLRYII